MKAKLLGVLAAMTALAVGSTAFAQLAYDDASDAAYSGGFSDSSNGGYGFSAWTINANQGTGFAGSFVGDPASGGISGMSASSFGLYANPDGSGASVDAIRSFSSALSVGQTFSFQWGVNWDSNGAGNKGFSLYSGGAGGTELVNINMGGSAAITINGNSMFANYGTAAMTLNFEITDPNTLRVYGIGRDGSESFDDTVDITGSSVDTFKFYAEGLSNDNGDNRQPYFNNLQVVPEPSTIVLGLVGVVGLIAARRRMAK